MLSSITSARGPEDIVQVKGRKGRWIRSTVVTISEEEVWRGASGTVCELARSSGWSLSVEVIWGAEQGEESCVCLLGPLLSSAGVRDFCCHSSTSTMLDALEGLSCAEDTVQGVPEWAADWLLFRKDVEVAEITEDVVSNGVVGVIEEENSPTMEQIFLPMLQDPGSSWIAGIVVTLHSNAVPQDRRSRFCWSLEQQYDDKFFSRLAPDGTLRVQRMAFTDEGEICVIRRTFVREPFSLIRVAVARVRQDCQFCFYRKEPCECSKTMRSRARNFQETLAVRMAEAGNTWDKFRLVLLGMVLERYVALVEVYDTQSIFDPQNKKLRSYWKYMSISFLTPVEASNREDSEVGTAIDRLLAVTKKTTVKRQVDYSDPIEPAASSLLSKMTNTQTALKRQMLSEEEEVTCTTCVKPCATANVCRRKPIPPVEPLSAAPSISRGETNFTVREQPRPLVKLDARSESMEDEDDKPVSDAMAPSAPKQKLQPAWIASHSDGKRDRACMYCGKTFPSEYKVQRHMAVHLGAQMKCTVCDLAVSDKSSLRRHMRRRHGAI